MLTLPLFICYFAYYVSWIDCAIYRSVPLRENHRSSGGTDADRAPPKTNGHDRVRPRGEKLPRNPSRSHSEDCQRAPCPFCFCSYQVRFADVGCFSLVRHQDSGSLYLRRYLRTRLGGAPPGSRTCSLKRAKQTVHVGSTSCFLICA